MKQDPLRDLTASPRTALVTGGATRVGRAVSQKLGESFHVIVHCHRSEKAGAALVDELNQSGRQATLLRADLCVPGNPGRLISEASAVAGRLDLLVNNAGIWADDTADLRTLAAMKTLNLDAPIQLIRAAAPYLESSGGSVVNIADIAALVPFPSSKNYSKTRAALLREVSGLALDLARRGVRVNTICPGTVLFADHIDPATRERIVDAIPMKRTGTPADVANLVVYLADATFMTGQIIALDGGRMLTTTSDR